MIAKITLIILLCFSNLCLASTVMQLETEQKRQEIHLRQENTKGFIPILKDGKDFSVLKLKLPKLTDDELEFSEVVLSNGANNIVRLPLHSFGINLQEYVGVEINKNIVMVATFKLTYTNTIYIVECQIYAL
ncbi:hypothetical protein ACJJIE_14360 [Microbulbifer sp. TRSA001]|uniref:hypothetical protein n=1 Tax=Microbulbifer sp. TRSA001 TaxID=3243381 RepID=UPI00403A2B64